MKFELEQGHEYWLGLHNFYVITRYNHSAMYAMSVYQLSRRLADRSAAVFLRSSSLPRPGTSSSGR